MDVYGCGTPSAGRGMKRRARTTLLTVVLLGLAAVLPSSASAAVCSEFANQAAAQAAANTVDADHDGVYCESLPCPCSTASSPAPAPAPAPPPPPPPPPAPSATPLTAGPNPTGCKRPKGVQRLAFSKQKYPNIRAHVLKAIAGGWPKVMVVNRKGAPQRRNRLLELMPTKTGFDRDEYPAAVGRGKANGASQGLIAGTDPIGWLADIAYVPSSENRSHGSSLGAKLRRLCNGTHFRYAFS
jgi:hypothetical protein